MIFPAKRARPTSGGASAWLLFGVWLVPVLGLLLFLVRLHAPLSGPSAQAQSQKGSGHWKVVHVLAAGCPCSDGVARALARRGLGAATTGGVEEAVVMLGADLPMSARLTSAGWPVAVADPEESRNDYGIGSAPWLLIYDPEGRLRYSGGYRAFPAPSATAASALEDLVLLRRLQAGEELVPYPSFGCAVSERSRRAADPLGLKEPRPASAAASLSTPAAPLR